MEAVQFVPLLDFLAVRRKRNMHMESYLTVKQENSAEFTEKRSRFIGYVRPVQTQAQAEAFIAEIRQKHWDAKHNVYAYSLRAGSVKRYSDDGEPQGTAGIPVLDVLEKSGVTDVCVVATRYFGGILLGGGGLVRAYSHTASIALQAGSIIRLTLCDELHIRTDYAFFTKLSTLIRENGGTVEDTVFNDAVELRFTVSCTQSPLLCAAIFDLSNGRFSAEKVGEKFAEILN